MKINKANQLTLLRLVLIVPFLIFLELSYWDILFPTTLISVMKVIFRILALAVFIIAALTDYYDGKIARETNTVTDFGKLMDPIADKLLTFTFILVLVEKGILSVILVLILIFRELFITLVRVYVSKESGKIIPASKLGKSKTIALYVALVIIGLMPRVYVGLPYNLIINSILILPAVILSVVSGIEYINAVNKGD